MWAFVLDGTVHASMGPRRQRLQLGAGEALSIAQRTGSLST
jgi:hypothetical protein